MRMLLVDSGNTSVKYRLIDDAGTIHSELRWFRKDAPPNSDVLSELQADEIWISDVQGAPIPLPTSENTIWVHKEMRFPFSFGKSEAEAYGIDRLCMISALKDYYQQGFLLVCLGSAITYNVYHPEKGFLGGAISPGMQMRFRALHDYTGKLPLSNPKGTIHFPETETLAALRCGVVAGITHEIKGFTDAWVEDAPAGIHLILSGGDTLYFEKRLKYPYFVVPDLVLMGLYRLAILNRNV